MSAEQPAPPPTSPDVSTRSFYRFRATAALLEKHQELQDQYIYFSPPEHLNDPMEGLRDLYWQGDEIVWRNLLRHYLLCLTQCVAVAIVAGKDFNIHQMRGVVFGAPSLLPTDQYRAHFDEIWTTFIAGERANELPALLAQRTNPIRRDELEYYLGVVHSAALGAISKVFRQHNLMPPKPDSNSQLAMDIEVTHRLASTIELIVKNPGDLGGDVLRAVFSANDMIMKQIRLRKFREAKTEMEHAWYPIFYGFPEYYIDSLKNLIFIDWYAACFVADPFGLSMWGHYGDGHKGVCLKFRGKIVNEKPVLGFKGIIGFSGGGEKSRPVMGDIVLPFEKVTYGDKLIEIDFFRSIGRLPVPRLKEMWFTNPEGQRSACAEGVLSRADAWRSQYWANFRAMTTTKLNDWSSESEYRLVLGSVLDSFTDPAARKLRYDFNDLEGVIFGIRTPVEDKVRIVDVIAKKLTEHHRKTFEFGQATYNSQTGKIEVRPLNLLLKDALQA